MKDSSTLSHSCPTSPRLRPAGVHGGGDDASPAGRERRRHEEPLPEGQEEERPVVGVSPPRPAGQPPSSHRHRNVSSSITSPMILSVLPQVNLNELAKKLGVGSGNLRFADEAAMLEKLKVRRG